MERSGPASLHKLFSEIRTEATGIMGYLAMLQQGDFKGDEQRIMDRLRPSVAALMGKMEDLRDTAARGDEAENKEVVAAILAAEPKVRVSLKALSQRLASSVVGWPRSEWDDTLRVMQGVIREINMIQESLARAGLRPHEA
jgi:hypothetical protein